MRFLFLFALILALFVANSYASCGGCCADSNECDAAFRGEAGICCGTRYLNGFEKPFCCPEESSCITGDDGSYRCRFPISAARHSNPNRRRDRIASAAPMPRPITTRPASPGTRPTFAPVATAPVADVPTAPTAASAAPAVPTTTPETPTTTVATPTTTTPATTTPTTTTPPAAPTVSGNLANAASAVGAAGTIAGRNIAETASNAGHTVAEGASNAGHTVVEETHNLGHTIAAGAENINRRVSNTIAEGTREVGTKLTEGANKLEKEGLPWYAWLIFGVVCALILGGIIYGITRCVRNYRRHQEEKVSVNLHNSPIRNPNNGVGVHVRR